MSTLVRKYVEKVTGPGPHTVRHDLDTQWVHVSVYDATSYEVPMVVGHEDRNVCVVTVGIADYADPGRPRWKAPPTEDDPYTIVVIG